mmetsp:Transcript_98158/g.302628  ORF Transcript_98158/g.302628 Transcript_98158/m.302628 type:complete len:278 (-) Transcript_98158:23-856(-)
MSAAVKRCRPFLQRAEELATHAPVVAHYCRVYAISLLAQARQAGDSSADLQAALLQELDRAEAAKKTLDLSSGHEAMEAFALGVFERVNAADCSGAADAGTASQYYVAGLFLEVCAQFYGEELPPDLAEKARFAKYRAVHIRDCLRRSVAPDPPGGGPEPAPDELPGATAAVGTALPAEAHPPVGVVAPVVSAAPLAGSGATGMAGHTAAPPQAALPQAVHASGPPLPVPVSSSEDAWASAKKQTEFAASALDFKDVPTARKCLLVALQSLDSCIDC